MFLFSLATTTRLRYVYSVSPDRRLLMTHLPFPSSPLNKNKSIYNHTTRYINSINDHQIVLKGSPRSRHHWTQLGHNVRLLCIRYSSSVCTQLGWNVKTEYGLQEINFSEIFIRVAGLEVEVSGASSHLKNRHI